MTKRHTVIFGLGITGYSCIRFLSGTDRLTVIDTRAAPPFADEARSQHSNVKFILGDAKAADFVDADRIVVSPGLRTTSCFLDHARAPVVGITGTNGKSTVTALTGELLRDAGLNVGVGGNLGEAALDLL